MAKITTCLLLQLVLMSPATASDGEISASTKYMGCYDDVAVSDNDRDLPVFAGRGSISECAALCKGYKYFGHQATMECWCGNKYGKFGKSKYCVCDDPNDVGAGVNCVYEIMSGQERSNEQEVQATKAPSVKLSKTPKRKEEAATPAPSTSAPVLRSGGGDARFLGCYEDIMDGTRDLPHFVGTGSRSECADRCKGYTYFAQQSFMECWCGDTYGKFGKTVGCQCEDPTDVGAGVNCVYETPQSASYGKPTKEESHHEEPTHEEVHHGTYKSQQVRQLFDIPPWQKQRHLPLRSKEAHHETYKTPQVKKVYHRPRTAFRKLDRLRTGDFL